MRMRTRTSARRGFTLIEVLLVLTILGLLAAVAIVGFTGQKESAKIKTTTLLLHEVGTAIGLYDNDIGHYPTEEEGGLNALITKPTFEDEVIAEQWHGPYLEKEPRDAWSRPLTYEFIGATGTAAGTATGDKPYHLWSNGPDGQSGTEDDIKNWSDEKGR
jgi:general secretion pathway protein G